MTALEDLPNEILLLILELLPARDILNFSMTTSQYRRVVHASSRIQFIITLFEEGLKPDHSLLSNKSASKDYLDSFRIFLAAWNSLEPVCRSRLPVHARCICIHKEIFAQVKHNNQLRPRALEFRKLHGQREDGMLELWKEYDDVGFEVVDLVFDPGQDLLVLVKSQEWANEDRDRATLHIRTLSGNIGHPLAAATILTVDVGQFWVECCVKVYGTTLACFFYDPDSMLDAYNRLCVWNWHTGTLLYTRLSVGGYALLTTDLVLILVQQDPRQTHGSTGDHRPLALEVCNVYSPSNSGMTLELPLTYTPLNIAMTASGFPSQSLQISKESFVDKLAAEDMTERIIDIHFPGHKVFISTHRILMLHHRVSNNEIQPAPSTTDGNWFLPWEVWSPDVTFWLPMICIRATLMPNYDGRACFSVNGNEIDEKGKSIMEKLGIDTNLALDEEVVVVFDFNRRPINRVAGDCSHPQEWQWNSEDGVDRPIISRLPFRIFQKKVRASFEALYMGHLRLITHNNYYYEVLQFS
ncbi:hypothetical protein CPB86DRAFT_819041 [Serendipita vermifera]|nr:hypothetical protein CPB86DRAFT_819041 [Serendipita vermifera]